jgi:hypothetical protein
MSGARLRLRFRFAPSAVPLAPALATGWLAVAPTISCAQDLALQRDAPLLTLSMGEAQVFDKGARPIGWGVEFRGRSYTRWKLMPALGAVAVKSGANFIFADLKREFWLNDRWLLTPSFGVGVFNASSYLRLGYDVEFRSGLELTRLFHRDYRFGIALFHISNGGLSDHNPGTEVLVVSLGIPLRDRFAQHAHGGRLAVPQAAGGAPAVP